MFNDLSISSNLLFEVWVLQQIILGLGRGLCRLNELMIIFLSALGLLSRVDFEVRIFQSGILMWVWASQVKLLRFEEILIVIRIIRSQEAWKD